jgi:hypothetical protein
VVNPLDAERIQVAFAESSRLKGNMNHTPSQGCTRGRTRLGTIGLGLLIGMPFVLSGGDFAIDWHQFNAPSVSLGGSFSIEGTAGERGPVAPLVGGRFVLIGGVASSPPAAPTGDPVLSIHLVDNGVIVAWPASTTGWLLQSSSRLGGGVWDEPPVPWAANSVTNTRVGENRFYRLAPP